MLKSKNFILNSEKEWIPVAEGVSRQILGYNENIMTVKVKFEIGSVGSIHCHLHDQTTYVASGVFEFLVGEETKIVKAGDGLFIESNVEHGVACIESGILIDSFSPFREDFLA